MSESELEILDAFFPKPVEEPKVIKYKITPKLPGFIDPTKADGEKNSPTRGYMTAYKELAARLAKDTETRGLSLVCDGEYVFAVENPQEAFKLWQRLTSTIKSVQAAFALWDKLNGSQETSEVPDPQDHPFPTTIYREPTDKKAA